MKKQFLLGMVFLISGCVSSSDFTDARVIDSGTDVAGAFCSDFTLSKSSAQAFFDKSHEVDMKVFHDQYDYLPCFIKGHVKKGNQNCLFTLRAGGTAELECGEKFYFYVCDECDGILGGE